jgi:hypothetical protein
MQVGPKDTDQLSDAYNNSDLASNQGLDKNIAVQFIFKNIFIFDFGYLFLKRENQIPRTRTWEC